ncbi:MAG: ABC transporter ATP-binding protein [Singulisphaera sp.]
MIRVRDLRVDYDDVCAVRDLSLEVGPGEICGLIGPNGAGKTTTMRAMLGLIEPTFGEIELDGVDMRERPRDACRLVGFMPDFPPLYDDLKVWEFLDLFAASYFVPRPERPATIGRHLELVGLTEKRDAMVVGLSRGMRQRLMLAKTLIPGPRVLMLDEPASGMDPRGRIDLKNILKALGAEGKTVLISSHILAEMTEFCTSVAIMERGRMVVSGTIEDVKAGDGGPRARGRGARTGRRTAADRRRRPWRARSSPATAGTGPPRSRSPTAADRTRPASCWPAWSSARCASPRSPGAIRGWRNSS